MDSTAQLEDVLIEYNATAKISETSIVRLKFFNRNEVFSQNDY